MGLSSSVGPGQRRHSTRQVRHRPPASAYTTSADHGKIALTNPLRRALSLSDQSGPRRLQPDTHVYFSSRRTDQPSRPHRAYVGGMTRPAERITISLARLSITTGRAGNRLWGQSTFRRNHCKTRGSERFSTAGTAKLFVTDGQPAMAF